MNQQLLDYISEQLQAGLSYSAIESALLSAGWDATDVKQALASFASKQNDMSQPEAVSAQASTSTSSQPTITQPAEPELDSGMTPAEPSSAQVADTTPPIVDTSGLAAVVGEAAVNRAAEASALAQNVQPQSAAPDLVGSAPDHPMANSSAMPGIVSSTSPAAVGSQPQATNPMPDYSSQMPNPANMPAAAQPQAPGFEPVNAAPAAYQQPYAQSPQQPYASYVQPQYPTAPSEYPYPAPAEYGQPSSGGGGFGEIFAKNKKLIIIIGGAVGFLVLITVLVLVLASGKKTNNTTNTTTNENANSLTEGQAFASERGGFSINPPKGWKAQELTSTSDVNVVISKETSDKAQISSMQVSVSTIQDSQAATTNLDSFVNFYKTTTTQSNPLAKINDDQKINLNGVDARLLDIDSVNDSTKVTGYMVYVIKDKRLYQIQALTFDVGPNSATKKAMRSSIDTFKLTGAAGNTSSSPSASPSSKP